MMKALSILVFSPLLLIPSLMADEVIKAESPMRPKPVEPVVAKMPWVGLQVASLSMAMRAHAGDIPKGIGFLVNSVTAGGPAEEAGVKSFDILWKLDDQLLVNEAQFAALLQLRQVGDTVDLGIIRSGRREQLELTLGQAPAVTSPAGLSPLEVPLLPMGVPGLPRSIVYPQQRKALISREDGGTAELRYEDGRSYVLIENSEGEVIYEGQVMKDGKMAVPKEWRRSVGALVRTMDQAKSGNWQPRRPRPRVVTPPPTQKR